MSDPLESLHLKLPYLAAAQAQKHVTHNEALRRLDNLVQLAVLGSTRTDPPETPAEGDRYIVATGGTGAWAGHDGDLASFVDGAWDFDTPEDGWLAFDVAAGVLLAHRALGWAAVSGVPSTVDHFGIHATADDTNRLAVRSEAVLFSGIDAADGGSGDIRFIVNKEADGDSASLLFQSGWSGRAEVGLCGDADFVFKVSADGTNWIEAIRIDKDTGRPTLIYDNSVSGLTATTLQDALDEVAAGGGGGGSTVVSVFGRTGTVAAAAGDYDASQLDNDSAVSGATVKDALNTLASGLSGKQESDADLTALAGISAAGLLVRTGAGTAAARTLTGSNGVTVSNGDGVSASPAIAADIAGATDLAAPARDDELLIADTSASGAVRKADVASIIDLARPTEAIVIACSDETTALSAGTGKRCFRMPYAFTVTEVRATLVTAQSSGAIFTVDINEAGTTILSTKLTVDNTEKTSTTAAAAPVISDSALADDAEMTVDIDQIGDGTAKGLKVTLIGHRT
jgi:hypothetical protein